MPGVGTTHHIELGGHYYIIRPNTYMKKAAPQFGARFTTGDPDFNNLSMWQHWAQKCFIGGFDQDVWADDAMYDEGIGLDTTDHEKVRLTRDLSRGTGANWAQSSATAAANQGAKYIVYNGKLYLLTLPDLGTEARLWEYQPGTDAWTRITALDAKNICARSVAIFDGKLYIGGVDSVTGFAKVVYDDGNLGSWTVLANPAGMTTAGHIVRAMLAFQSKLYVAYGTSIWRSKPNQTWDGNTVFYEANMSSSSNAISSMEVHLGFLYMLSINGHVHRTDGNSSFDIWNWDGQTQGVAIRSFDGRLFILTFEYTNTADAGWGVLYQMSGSAMTQLKRFGDEGQATRIGNMRAYDRRLFYGASNLLGFGNRPGFGVAAYDPVEDAHSVMCSNADTVTYGRGVSPFPNYLVDDIYFFGGRLFVYVRGYGSFKTPYKYKDTILTPLRRHDTTSAGASLASTNGGWLSTSTYDAGTPGVKKLWRKITVDVDLPATTGIVIDYSTNNGASWTQAGTASGAASRRQYDVFLDNVIATSFKLRFTLRSTTATSTPIFYGYVVSYLPLIEPNWMWSFTVVLAEKLVLLDGTEQVLDTEAELTFLDTTYRTKALVHFTDAQGVQWPLIGAHGALIYDITYNLRDLNKPLEGDVTITLIEAVETY